MVTYRHKGTRIAKRCCAPFGSPLQKGTLRSTGVKKPVRVRITSIFSACGTLYTGLFVIIRGKTVMPIFHFVALQAFSLFRCAFLPLAVELFHYDAS